MNLEKVRKPVENGGVDWDKGCNKSALWQGGTSLVNSSGGGVGWGIMGWWQKAQRRGQQWKLGLFLVLPRQEQWVTPGLVPCPSFLISPLLPRVKGDITTATTARVHSQTEASLDFQFVCLFSWLTIDRLYPTAHLQSAYQASFLQHITMATPFGSGILDIAGSFCFQQQAKGVLQPWAAPLPAWGSLLLQPPHLTTRAWLLQLPLALLGFFFPFLPLFLWLLETCPNDEHMGSSRSCTSPAGPRLSSETDNYC